MNARLEELKEKRKALDTQIAPLVREMNLTYADIKIIERVMLKEKIVNRLKWLSQRWAYNHQEEHGSIVRWAKEQIELGKYVTCFSSDAISEIIRELVSEGVLKEHSYCGPPTYHGSTYYSIV